MLGEMNIKDFLDETASSSPVPGGGSVAALSGALSAALTHMVANLTIGKKNYENVQGEFEDIMAKTEELKDIFVEYIDKDSDSFNEVMKAFKLPKDTEEEKQARSNAIQEATKYAALVPLETARKAYAMMDYIKTAVEKGNKNAASDAAVAAMLCRTAVLSALYNVKINLSSIKDIEFKESTALETDELEKNIKLKENEILDYIASVL
ncbi:MAG: cyclodeaminase/cyclohydrolase family protein [Solirubrobacterales bacterium]